MSIFKSKKIRVLLLAFFILTGCVLSTIKVSEYNYRPYIHDNLYLPSGKFLKEISLGYKQLVADFVWLSAVQYFGDYSKGNHDLVYFRGLIDIVTSLDPHFIFAYIFGALVVAEDIGAFSEGIDILKTGMIHNPSSWELPFEIGFLNYIDRKNNQIAANYFDLASRMPGSPPRASRFAAFVYSKAGHEKTAIRMWEEIRNNSDEPFMRELAQRYIEKLKAKRSTKDTHAIK